MYITNGLILFSQASFLESYMYNYLNVGKNSGYGCGSYRRGLNMTAAVTAMN